MNKNLNEQVPEWANFFTEDEYSNFIIAVTQYFSKLGADFRVDNGVLLVDENAFGFGQLGLLNVAQRCKQSDESDYDEIVRAHFESMRRSKEFTDKFEEYVDDFEQAKAYIGVRLYAYDYISHLGEDKVLGKPYAEGIYAMLVFDLPDTVMNIQPEQLEKWGKSLEEVYALGIENIQNKYAFDFRKEDIEGMDIFFSINDHFFTGNILFDIDQYEGALGKKGALVGFPHRHTIIFKPIDSMDFLSALNFMISATYGMHQEGPGSVSPHLYWYYEGKLMHLPYEIEDNTLKFIPPQEFNDMLEDLGE
jgi:hypothetical protein